MTVLNFGAGFLFAGLGAGARGFLEARAQLGGAGAAFRSVGGVDNDALACADFERLTGSPATCADLATMTPAELRAAWGEAAPDVVFTSPPCKGFSGLLSTAAAGGERYQLLNRLVLQGVWLLLESWPTPPAMIVLENVPRIATRGALLLAQVRQLLAGAGYLLHEGFHDCGEIGGLAQHRRRFLLVARRPAAVPAFVYKPPLQRVRACGEVLGPLPLPEDATAGPLHRLPRLSWLNWIRLALIPAGGDWRDLPTADEARAGRMGVRAWGQAAQTVCGESYPSNGSASVADPRLALGHDPRRGALGVGDWRGQASTVRGRSDVRTGPAAIADPRMPLGRTADGASSFKGRPGLLGVGRWDEPAPTVTGHAKVSGGNATAAIADPRLAGPLEDGQRRGDVFKREQVLSWDQPADTVTAATGNQRMGVADPRVPLGCAPRAGAYGVAAWDHPAAAVTGAASIDNGPFAVAAPNPAPLPASYRRMTLDEAMAQLDERFPPRGEVPVILSPHDGTWHRPLTTLELAALQGMPAQLDGAPLTLAGRAAAKHRERVGNAVPVGAGLAIAESLLQALLAAALGTWTLGSTGIWVREEGAAA